MAISRIVILPEFQGIGLSSKILNFCGGVVKACGEEYNLYIKTIHEKMGEGLERNSLWNPTGYNGKLRKDSNDVSGKYKKRLQRASYCYRYDGEPLYGLLEEVILTGLSSSSLNIPVNFSGCEKLKIQHKIAYILRLCYNRENKFKDKFKDVLWQKRKIL